MASTCATASVTLKEDNDIDLDANTRHCSHIQGHIFKIEKVLQEKNNKKKNKEIQKIIPPAVAVVVAELEEEIIVVGTTGTSPIEGEVVADGDENEMIAPVGIVNEKNNCYVIAVI